MTIRKISRAELEACCSAPGPDDGLDPRYQKRGPSGRPLGRKTLQLCGQVARTLSAVLAESGDEVLRDLVMDSVTPVGGGRLLVTLALAASAAPGAAGLAVTRLEHAHGRLRSEVAAAVHRRRAPDLVFRVVGQG